METRSNVKLGALATDGNVPTQLELVRRYDAGGDQDASGKGKSRTVLMGNDAATLARGGRLAAP